MDAAPQDSPLKTQYWRILVANFGSTTGSQISLVATPLLALELGGTPTLAATVSAVNAATRFAGGLVAGVMADRMRPRRVLVGSTVAALLSMACLSAALMLHEVNGWMFVILIAVEGAAAVVFAPAEDVLIRDTVTPGQLTSAYSWSEAAVWTAALVGPAIGGLLYGESRTLPFAANAASYLVVLTLILPPFRQEGLDKGKGAGQQGLPRIDEFALGFRTLWRDRFLRRVILQVPTHNIVLGALTIYIVAQLNADGRPSDLIGLYFTSQACGALAGTIWSKGLSNRLGPGKTMIANGGLWSVAIPCAVLSPGSVILLAASTTLWLLAPAQRSSLATYQANHVPSGHLGKVRSASGVIIQLASITGPFVGAALFTQGKLTVAMILTSLTASPVVVSIMSSEVRSVGTMAESLSGGGVGVRRT